MKDYYKIIGVNKDAELSTIKNSYVLKLKKYHPDVYAGDKAFAEQKTSELNEAFEVLKDEQKRKEYDTKLNGKKSKKQSQDKNNWFNIIIQKIKVFFKNQKEKIDLKKKQKYAKKLKTSESSLSKEQVERIKDKKKLNFLIIVMVIAIGIIIIAMVN